MRYSTAVRQAGGAAAEMLWQFPVASHLAHANRDDFMQAWDSLHAGHAAEQMLRQFVLTLRVWRPDVVVTDGPDAGATDFLVAEALREAVKAAADPKMFPEQISVMGLEPWKASKLYGRCDGHTEGPVSLDLTVVSGALQTTPREYAEVAAAYFGDEAATIPARRSYRLLAANTPGGQDHHDLMQGVELAHRRPRPTAVGCDRSVAGAGQSDPSAGRASNAVRSAHRRPDRSGKVVESDRADARRHARRHGRPRRLCRGSAVRPRRPMEPGPRDVLDDGGPLSDPPATPDAFRWLIRHNCSSEARRRNELGQFVVIGQLEYGQVKAGRAGAADAALGRQR